MVKLFISDIDGCLSEPYQRFPLDKMSELAKYVAEAGDIGSGSGLPAFSILSGRAYSYVEAMTQMLGIVVPVLFESGGGLFDPVRARVIWNPLLSRRIEDQLSEVRAWLTETCLPGTSMMFDYGKRTQAGIIGPDREEVQRMAPVVRAYVEERFADLRVFHTPISIDVVPRGLTKREAIHWLAHETGVAAEHMAFIGDTNGDLEALQEVGCSFAPANAAPEVLRGVRKVMDAPCTEGVIDAYLSCFPSAAG